MSFIYSSEWSKGLSFSNISNLSSALKVFTFKVKRPKLDIFSWNTFTPLELALKLIDELFFIENYKTVLFLKENNYLIPLILNAYLEITKRFEGSFSLKLELDDEGEMLYLLIVGHNMNADKAYKILDSFDDEWWIHHVTQSRGKMNIDLELD